MGDTDVLASWDTAGAGSPQLAAGCSRQRAAKGKFQPKRAFFPPTEVASALAPLCNPGKCHCRDEKCVPKELEGTGRCWQQDPQGQGSGSVLNPPILTQVSAFVAQKG